MIGMALGIVLRELADRARERDDKKRLEAKAKFCGKSVEFCMGWEAAQKRVRSSMLPAPWPEPKPYIHP